jgi:predicted HicB family RNase H-like nuclease
LLAHGDTPEEAIREAGIALEGVIEVHKESGLPLPEPQLRQEYSGQFRLRLPRSLHRRLAEIAQQEGTSLNGFVVAALAEKAGAETAKKDAEKVAINIQTVHLAPNITINNPGTGNIATTDIVVDRSADQRLWTKTCRDQ